MGMTELFQQALANSNNAIRAVRIEALDKQLEQERQERRASSATGRSDSALSAWIDQTIHPNAFVTLLLPFTPGYRPVDNRRVRDHHYYLNIWTRKAEAALWGASTFHIKNYDDRCLFFVVRETVRQDWLNDGTLRKLTHYHALCRMPSRPMLVERERGTLTTDERSVLLQAALVEASKGTPEPYARRNSLDYLRGANIQVRPYRPEHAKYIFKQLRPSFREHWMERLDGPLVRDHEMFILPHLERRYISRRNIPAVEVPLKSDKENC